MNVATDRLAVVAEELRSIQAGSAATGRWLDEKGTECEESAPGAVWELYSEEEQAAWLSSVSASAGRGLEALEAHRLQLQVEAPGIANTERLAEALQALSNRYAVANPADRDAPEMRAAKDALAAMERPASQAADSGHVRILVLSDGATWETFNPMEVHVMEVTRDGFDELCEGSDPNQLSDADIISSRSLASVSSAVAALKSPSLDEPVTDVAQAPPVASPVVSAGARSEIATIPQALREQFECDSASTESVMAAAARKGNTCSTWEAQLECRTARSHFELGCWLHHYASRVYAPEGTQDRIDCVRRLWESGIHDVGYRFHSVFGFGEREFDTCFEMGDADEVAAALKQLARDQPDGPIAAGAKAMGWDIWEDEPEGMRP